MVGSRHSTGSHVHSGSDRDGRDCTRMEAREWAAEMAHLRQPAAVPEFDARSMPHIPRRRPPAPSSRRPHAVLRHLFSPDTRKCLAADPRWPRRPRPRPRPRPSPARQRGVTPDGPSPPRPASGHPSEGGRHLTHPSEGPRGERVARERCRARPATPSAVGERSRRKGCARDCWEHRRFVYTAQMTRGHPDPV